LLRRYDLSTHDLTVFRLGIYNDQLLDYEPRASDQVPLLLAMKEDRLALAKAVDSGDTDLGILFLYNILFCSDSSSSKYIMFCYTCTSDCPSGHSSVLLRMVAHDWPRLVNCCKFMHENKIAKCSGTFITRMTDESKVLFFLWMKLRGCR